MLQGEGVMEGASEKSEMEWKRSPRLDWQSKGWCAGTREPGTGATLVPAARIRCVFRGSTDEVALALEPAPTLKKTKRGTAESEIANQAENRIRRRSDCIDRGVAPFGQFCEFVRGPWQSNQPYHHYYHSFRESR